METRAVIIGVSDVIRLCTARAVGAAGYRVDIVRVGRKGGKCFKASDFYCKYVDNYFYFDETGSLSLPDFLIEKYKGSDQKPVLFTLGDKITHIIDEERSCLGDYFLFAHRKDGGSLSALMDKHFLKLQAEAAGFSVVKGWPITYENDEFSIPDDITYPCFVKGLYSYWDSKPIQRKCKDRTEVEALSHLCKSIYPHSLYAEEYVESKKEMGILGVCDGEDCVIPAETELVLMGEGSSHGVSMLGHVAPVGNDTDIRRKVERLLKRLGYVGIFNIDFILTEDHIFFVELNLRYATYGYGIYQAGINVPALFIGILTQSAALVPDQGIANDLFYFNEEIAYNSLVEGALSFKKYNEIRKQADLRFVQSADDPKPLRQMKFLFALKYIRMLKKRIRS